MVAVNFAAADFLLAWVREKGEGFRSLHNAGIVRTILGHHSLHPTAQATGIVNITQ